MHIPSLWAEHWGKEVAAIQVSGKTKANFLWILEHMQRPNYMEKNRLPDYMEREVQTSQRNMASIHPVSGLYAT